MGLVLSKFSFGEDDYNPTFQPGTQFTIFTSTNVQILTPEAPQAFQSGRGVVGLIHLLY